MEKMIRKKTRNNKTLQRVLFRKDSSKRLAALLAGVGKQICSKPNAYYSDNNRNNGQHENLFHRRTFFLKFLPSGKKSIPNSILCVVFFYESIGALSIEKA